MRIAPLCLLVLAACIDGADTGDDGFAPDARDFDRPETSITEGPDELSNQATARFELTSDDPEATFTCATDGEPVPCTSPYEVTLTDGEWTIEVSAVNADGFTDPTPARWDWRIDTEPPSTRLLQYPAALDNSVSAYFQLDASEPGATFECAIDDGAFAPCLSPYFTPALTHGPHRFAAAAIDPAGNRDPDPATHAWTIDSSLPDTVIDSAPSGTTTSRTATITFSAPDAAVGSTFQCARGNGLWVACTSPWQLDGLADGVHTVHVRVREPSQNVDPTPATRSWTVDGTPPVVNITGGPFAVQGDSTPTFTFSASGAATVECRFTRAQSTPDFALCASPYTPSPLAEGMHTFEVRGTDAVGNNTVATRGFGVDTLDPVVTVNGPSGPTQDNTPEFTFSASEPVTWRCRVEWGSYTSCSSPYTAAALSDGSYTFYVEARDIANKVVIVQRQFTIDRQVWVSITHDLDSRTDDTTPSFTFITGDATMRECRIDSAAFVPCTSPYTSPLLSAGAHAFTVRVTDAAGNTDTDTYAFTVVTTPLDITITAGPTGDTPDRTPEFSWILTGAIAQVRCRYDASAFEDCTTVAAIELLDGPHTFEVRGQGDSGTTVYATRSFTVDTVAPGVVFNDGPTGTTSATTVTFAFTTSGNPAVTECRLFRDGQASGAYTPCASPHTIELSPPSSPFPSVFEVRVRDQAGNQWSAYRSFIYVAPPLPRRQRAPQSL